MQSTFSRRESAASGISAGEDTPLSTISNPYSEAASLYSSIAEIEFTSLVLYMIPMVFASGSMVRIISS